MRRAPAPLALLAVLAGAAPAAASDTALRARLASCATGPLPAERRAAFTASMPARAGAAVLAMRFSLQRHAGDGWRRVPAATFDRWERSTPGAAGLSYTKQVDGLWGPARFRVVVRFAWHDASGRVVARAVRRSGACRQPDRRPDLYIAGVQAHAGEDGAATWLVTVGNRGAGPAAAPFAVAAGDAGAVVDRDLPADATRTVRVEGRACAPGEVVRVAADPAGVLADRRRADNAVDVPCPL